MIILTTGVFALSPIKSANTVHTAIIGDGGLDLDDISNTQQEYLIRSDSGTNISDNDTVVIDCNENFIVIETLWTLTDHDSSAGERIDVGVSGTTAAITINGAGLTDRDGDPTSIGMFSAGGVNDDVTTTVSWNGLAERFPNAFFPVLLAAQGDGNNDIVFNLQDAADSLDTTDQLTVTATIISESNAICSVTINS